MWGANLHQFKMAAIWFAINYHISTEWRECLVEPFRLSLSSFGSWVDYYYLSYVESKCKILLWSKHDYELWLLENSGNVNICCIPIQYTRDIEPMEAELWDSGVIIWHNNVRMWHNNVNNSIIISKYDIIMTLCIWPFNVLKSESRGLVLEIPLISIKTCQ